MKTSSPKIMKNKRKRLNNSNERQSSSNDELIYSYRDEIRDKDEKKHQKESQLIKYEIDIDKLKEEKRDLIVNRNLL